MLEKNKFAYVILQTVKENIINNKELIYNPIILIGLEKERRYRFFWCVFDKDFNSKYKSLVNYKTIDKIDLETTYKKKLIILENIHEIVENEDMQDKLHELLNLCFKEKIQVILCSDENIEKLEINEILKSKMLYGLKVWLNEN